MHATWDGPKSSTPMIAAGRTLQDRLTESKPSIFRQDHGVPMPPHILATFREPVEKFPDTKASRKKTTHSFSNVEVTERPGKESRDVVLGNGKSVRVCVP